MYLLYPFLLCLFPIHSIFAENYAEIDIKDYLNSCLTIIIISAIGIIGLNFFIHNWAISELCYITNYFLLLYANYIFIGLFSSYSRTLKLNKILFTIFYLTLCTIISYIIIALIPLTLHILMSKILWWTSLFISLFIIPDLIKRYHSFYPQTTTINEQNPNMKNNLPNIYHIIPDAHTGFARPEYCDTNFKEELLKRNFNIYENALSNYDMTYCSIPSCLNMDYINNFMESKNDYYPKNSGWQFYSRNKFFKILRENNYELSFAMCKELGHLTGDNSINILSSDLLSIFFFSSLLFIWKQSYAVNANSRIFDIFEKYLKLTRKKTNNPQYVFMHCLAPHVPYLLDENGNQNKEEDYNNKTKYFGYQKFINKELIKLIDNLKQNISENSIILIHGDHSETALNKHSHKILLAAHFPPSINPNILKKDQTLVNLFRTLCNELFDTNFEELENKFYHVNYSTGYVYEATEVEY